MKQNRMREEMKEAFINALKEDQIPWNCDWVRMGRPENAVTGKPYRGVNSFWLSYTQDRKGYQDPRWCTFKQAQKEGWKVQKGEKGTRVEFWSLYDTETKEKISSGKAAELKEQLGDDFYDRIKPVSSVYTVFNAEQIEGIPELITERAHPVPNEELLVGKRDVLLKNMGLSFKEGGNEAFYQPKNDQITMPEMERFQSGYGYMSTFLHEAGHATGHESRLNRNIKNSFGTPDYAREELRAEIASAFVSRELEIGQADPKHMENHKAYVQDWITVLEKDPNELFAAFRDAEKISDYLIEKGEFNLIREKEMKELQPDAAKTDQKEEVREESEKALHRTAAPGSQFDPEQAKEIQKGREERLDVSIYANPDLDALQMYQIRLGLKQGIDASIYADPQYTYNQMAEIRKGLENGVDVSLYADLKYTEGQMVALRLGLEDKVDISCYTDTRYKYEQMMEIRKGLMQGVDISVYADPKYNALQMGEIRQGLEKGLDVSIYARSEFDRWQMEKIRKGLEQELDVSVYASPEFSSAQMNQILIGLEEGLDVNVYADPKFSSGQMMDILEGLEKGQDIMRSDQNTVAKGGVNEMEGFNKMQRYQNTTILGYYSAEDGTQYIKYLAGDSEKEFLTTGVESWNNPEDIKHLLSQLKQIPHLPDRNVMMEDLQKNQPDEAITGYMQKIVGEVSYSTNRAVGEVIQYTSAEEYLKTVREDIEYQSSSGFEFQTFTNDPEVLKGIDDIVYDQYGERNPHDLDYYRNLHKATDEKGKDIMEKNQNTVAKGGVNEMTEFNKEQMEQIQEGLDVSAYARPEFDEWQIEEIRKGLEAGVDVRKYADPKYNEGQMMEIRDGLEEGLDVSVYADPKFTWEQMSQIRMGLEKEREQAHSGDGMKVGLDVSIYADPNYNPTQMSMIRKGLEEGLDVSVYADPKFTWEQMSQIQEGLDAGLDVSVYADPRYNFSQMAEIRLGLKDGLDVTVYADPKFAFDQMNRIREGLEKGVDVRAYADPKFDQEQMDQILKGLESGLDVSVYADPRLESIQMAVLRDGLGKGVNAAIYADPKYNYKEMMNFQEGLQNAKGISLSADFDPWQKEQILHGLNQKVDVSVYADPKFKAPQMEQIRYGLVQRVDVGVYADPKYGFLQMSEIRKGLESGLDVSIYANPDLDALQMNEIRLGLEKEKKQSQIKTEKQEKDQKGKDRQELQQGQGISQEQVESRTDYSLIQDVAEMEKKLNLPPEERMTELSEEDSLFKPKSGVKEADLQKRQGEFKKYHTSLFSTQEAAKIRLVARGRNIWGFHPDPVHLQTAQMIREYQKSGLDIKDIVTGKLEEIRTKTGIEDARYAKNLVCSLASQDRQSYEEYMGYPAEENAGDRAGDVKQGKEPGEPEQRKDIFHGNQKEGAPGEPFQKRSNFYRNGNMKSPAQQARSKQIMRGMGR